MLDSHVAERAAAVAEPLDVSDHVGRNQCRSLRMRGRALSGHCDEATALLNRRLQGSRSALRWPHVPEEHGVLTLKHPGRELPYADAIDTRDGRTPDGQCPLEEQRLVSVVVGHHEQNPRGVVCLESEVKGVVGREGIMVDGDCRSNLTAWHQHGIDDERRVAVCWHRDSSCTALASIAYEPRAHVPRGPVRARTEPRLY